MHGCVHRSITTLLTNLFSITILIYLVEYKSFSNFKSRIIIIIYLNYSGQIKTEVISSKMPMFAAQTHRNWYFFKKSNLA